MGNQCGGCAGAPEEGEMNMKVETQARKSHSGVRDRNTHKTYDASSLNYNEEE